MLAVKSKCFKHLEKQLDPTPTPSVRHVVVDDPEGQRIDNFLLNALRGVPRARVYRLLRRGEVRVNGGRVKPTYRLQPGDRVRIPPVRLPTPDPEASASTQAATSSAVSAGMRLDLERALLHEDDALLVLNKPAGYAVHGGSGVSLGIIEALRELRDEPGLELAHRLDRDTSGCLVVARTRRALLELHEALRTRAVKKTYAALVHGRWPGKRRSVQLPLLRYVTRGGERRVRVDDHGKPSRTDFSVVEATDSVSWLQAFPQTGRTHQIRVHAAAVGNPLLGDDKYRPAALRKVELEVAGARIGLCLHAQQLSFEFRGRRCRFACAPPAEFQSAWAAFAENQ